MSDLRTGHIAPCNQPDWHPTPCGMVTLHAGAGELLHSVAQRAIALADDTDMAVDFVHNGVTVTAHSMSDVRDLRTIWLLRRQLARREAGA